MNLSKLFFLASAAMGLASAQIANTIVMTPVKADISPDLVSMMLTQPAVPMEAPSVVIQKHGPLIGDTDEAGPPRATAVAPFLQDSTIVAPALSATPGANFEGLGTGLAGFVMTGAPPDETIAVGPNHVVQWVNSMFAIFNKAGGVVAGPTNGNALFNGFGGLCETTNRGDPLVVYDQAADRWVFSQFAFAVSGGSPATPYLQCFAVSTTSNPAGPYARYAYQFSAVSPSGFNDYGKIGVWPNAYYTSYNIFGGTPAGANTGVALCAHDRAKMIVADLTATMLCAPVAVYGGGAAFLPADQEGATTPPAASAAGVFARYSFAGVSLRLVRLAPNFGAGTVTLTNGQGGATGTFIDIPVGPLTVACNGASGACVSQPGTANRLDTLADRLMYRLGYRNRGGQESLIVNISVDPDGAGAQGSAVRWFEVRNALAAVPQLYQNATFNPNTTNRWMASLGMDKNGNIAMGYSVSDATTAPGIRITGRLRSDVRNRMQTESIIFNGLGSQTGTLDRWGDYSTMRVDPSDDCTFWYTNEYLPANGVFNWRTRIASFKFPNCQ